MYRVKPLPVKLAALCMTVQKEIWSILATITWAHWETGPRRRHEI